MSARGFQKILVANRGEIAVRIMQGLREMGIATVAVYSDIDRSALHVMVADEAYPIGPAPAAESYLNAGAVIDAARRSGAEAIHPGYGFLAENAGFAAEVEAAGLAFIGPTPESIELMGDKLAARRRMIQSGVPVIPGTEEAVEDPAAAVAAARRIGYPVLLKAAAGGGGKGMRVVRSEDQIAGALRQTRGEAKSAFGNGAIYIERFVERPKHIEVQVLGDGEGHAIHLYERECSVQRRHQKVIEESPSPSLTAELRESICAAAVRTAEAIAYRGAGTVEFILSPSGEFFFLEMNTRLQVEHPITEMVTGTDLVRAQIAIASAAGLPYRQGDVHQRGWALEFRIYAEDPARNFAPSIGRITSMVPPVGPGIRLDSGVYEGFAVPIHYDPLLAKLIVWAEDREFAIARAQRALSDFTLHGPGHNIPFHLWVLDQPEFREGSYTTGFVEERFSAEQILRPLAATDRDALLAAAALFEESRRKTGGDDDGRAAASPAVSPWRLAALRAMTGRS
jgi:acetyl-CoA carboxylase biotin carboxylase subunit